MCLKIEINIQKKKKNVAWKLDELTANETKLTLNLYNTCKISIPQLS